MDYALEKRKPITPKNTTPIARIANNAPRGSPTPQKSTEPQRKIVIAGAKEPEKDTKQVRIDMKVYTEDEIRDLTSDGYIMVFPGLWDRIPKGAHIRFLKKDTGKGLPRGARFKPGGFVRNHYTSEDGKKMMIIENKLNGKNGEFGYVTFPLAYEDLEIIWKKYDHDAFIEIHLIYNSLAQKKQQIEDLTSRVNRLENILRSAIKQ